MVKVEVGADVDVEKVVWARAMVWYQASILEVMTARKKESAGLGSRSR